MKKVCHMTSAHGIEDDRIFLKECISLAHNGYSVFLVEKGDSYSKNGVNILGVGNIPDTRFKRMLFGARKVFEAAVELDADIYHIHDPELLPYALQLKKKRKIVIFDSHEDVPAQIIDKTWIPKLLRNVVAIMYKTYETHIVKSIDAVVAATPHIAEQFQGRAKSTVIINNFPKLDDIIFHETPFTDRERIICYAGGIDELRGESVMVEAMRDSDDKLVIAGDHIIEEISII